MFKVYIEMSKIVHETKGYILTRNWHYKKKGRRYSFRYVLLGSSRDLFQLFVTSIFSKVETISLIIWEKSLSS